MEKLSALLPAEMLSVPKEGTSETQLIRWIFEWVSPFITGLFLKEAGKVEILSFYCSQNQTPKEVKTIHLNYKPPDKKLTELKETFDPAITLDPAHQGTNL